MLAGVDLEAIAAPISADLPAGEDLRYSAVYDEIREARRADDDSPQGAWQRKPKVSDWDKVVRVAADALVSKSKDFQIGAWLAEALAREDGFDGVDCGLKIMQLLLSGFWDTGYPPIEDNDYEFRAGTLEFLNDRLPSAIREIPLTDPRTSKGYTFLKWKESRDVGYESASQQDRRTEMISEGKITAEEFDAAVAKTSPAYYRALAGALSSSLESFAKLDAETDTRFGANAPSLAEIGKSLEECNRVVTRICKEEKGVDQEAGTAAGEPAEAPAAGEPAEAPAAAVQGEQATPEAPPERLAPPPPGPPGPSRMPAADGAEQSQESALWNQALGVMEKGGLREALDLLLAASCSQPSERGRSRYRFLVAKLCLKAKRPDLARPIVEQLHTTINELHLENWESPYWISEILESLYQCLVSPECASEDPARVQELFRRICIMDVTKALGTSH